MYEQSDFMLACSDVLLEKRLSYRKSASSGGGGIACTDQAIIYSAFLSTLLMFERRISRFRAMLVLELCLMNELH